MFIISICIYEPQICERILFQFLKGNLYNYNIRYVYTYTYIWPWSVDKGILGITMRVYQLYNIMEIDIGL